MFGLLESLGPKDFVRIEFFAIADGDLKFGQTAGLLDTGGFESGFGFFDALKKFRLLGTVGEHFGAGVEDFLVLGGLRQKF